MRSNEAGSPRSSWGQGFRLAAEPRIPFRGESIPLGVSTAANRVKAEVGQAVAPAWPRPRSGAPSLLNQPGQFYSCFISYNHTDKAFSRLLHDTLQGRGIRCWLDEKQLLPGDNIYDHVDRVIRFWDKLLLCCSEKSLTSWWVDNEIGKAFDKEQALMKDRKEKVHVLIPLSLDTYLCSGKWAGNETTAVGARR